MKKKVGTEFYVDVREDGWDPFHFSKEDTRVSWSLRG